MSVRFAVNHNSLIDDIVAFSEECSTRTEK